MVTLIQITGIDKNGAVNFTHSVTFMYMPESMYFWFDSLNRFQQILTTHTIRTPGHASNLREACDHGSIRRGMLSYLQDVTVSPVKRQRVATQFLAACGGSGGSVNKKGTQVRPQLHSSNREALRPRMRGLCMCLCRRQPMLHGTIIAQ